MRKINQIGQQHCVEPASMRQNFTSLKQNKSSNRHFLQQAFSQTNFSGEEFRLINEDFKAQMQLTPPKKAPTQDLNNVIYKYQLENTEDQAQYRRAVTQLIKHRQRRIIAAPQVKTASKAQLYSNLKQLQLIPPSPQFAIEKNEPKRKTLSEITREIRTKQETLRNREEDDPKKSSIQKQINQVQEEVQNPNYSKSPHQNNGKLIFGQGVITQGTNILSSQGAESEPKQFPRESISQLQKRMSQKQMNLYRSLHSRSQLVRESKLSKIKMHQQFQAMIEQQDDMEQRLLNDLPFKDETQYLF